METTPTTSTQQRSSRKRAFVILGLATALAGAATIAWAAGVGPAMAGHFGHGAHARELVEFKVHRALKQVNATQSQEDQILAIVDGLFERHKAMTPAREALHQRAAVALTADTVDRAALEAIRTDALRMADDGSKELVKAIADIADLLTPAQRRQLAELHKTRFE